MIELPVPPAPARNTRARLVAPLAAPLAAVLAGALLALSQPAGAADKLDPIPIVETWLLPRYDALVATTAAQKAAWTTFCAAPAPAGIAALKDAYGKTADAWNAVEFVTIGPISLDTRADRFSFFPDRRNAIARAMAEIISDTDASRLAPDRFAQTSAAVQGLPALERLLYDEGADAALAAGDEAARRCAFGLAIATNLATIASDVRTQWGDRTKGLLGAVVSGKGDPAFFPDIGALPGMILTDLAGAYQRVTDTKIHPVLGSGPADAKPKLADNWRSGRSGRVVTNMVKSADALLKAVSLQLPSRPQWVVGRVVTAADKAADAFPADLGAAAASDDGVAAIQKDIKDFREAQRAVYKPVASFFAISLGFNALDGD